MARFHGQDVRDKLVSLLTASMNTMLGTIDTERSQTTPTPKVIGYKWLENQRPLILVDLEDSELIQDEELTNDLDITPEIWKANINIQIKSMNADDLHNYIENYIEAIKRILNGYNDSNITWILITDTVRSELYQDKNQSMKMGMVT